MSRKKGRNAPQYPSPKIPDLLQKRQAVRETAEQLIEEAPELTEDHKQVAPAVEVTDAAPKLEDVVQRTAQAQAAYGAAKLRYEQLFEEVELRVNALDERELQIASREAEFDAHERQLQAREKLVAQQERASKEQATELSRREQDAELGFLDVRQRIQTQHDLRFEELKQALTAREASIHGREMALEKELASRQAALEGRYQERRAELTTQLQSRETESNAREEGWNLRLKELERRERRVQEDEEDLREERLLLEARAEKKAAGRLALLQTEHETLGVRVAALLEDRERQQSLLDEAKTELRRLSGGSDPQSVLLELRSLRADKERLQQELDNRPGVEVLQQLNDLLAERDELARREAQFAEKFNTHETRLRLANIQVTELESLKTERDALRTSRSLLTAKLTELREEVDKYTARHDDKSTFPACRDMDLNADLREEPEVQDRLGDLGQFVLDLQTRIASDEGLNYRAEDIRAFLGGLAASNLHILQGISGTGKTSLPRAFARAVGGTSSVLEVQAGWRDRSDLIGHYNAFERTFYESEFLKALYQARTPRYAKLPFFIVLDEMNLSHPEQYFADFLSMLEPAGERKLRLTSASSQNRPAGIFEDQKGGDYLPLPPNVWFIGTANQDETTKGFADKTYDRAHVMELLRNRDVVPTRSMPSRPPLSLQAFETAFDEARSKHHAQARQAYESFGRTFETVLLKKFNLAWGNRLERQWMNYLPVILAAGGSEGEAVDHLLATKVLRKLRNRFDVQAEDLRELTTLIERAFPKYGPSQSLRTLNLALRDHGEVDSALDAVYS